MVQQDTGTYTYATAPYLLQTDRPTYRLVQDSTPSIHATPSPYFR
jgi:hypothetical protein